MTFIIGVLLFYVGLVIAFLVWNLRRWLRGSGKNRAWPANLQRSRAWRIFNRLFGAR